MSDDLVEFLRARLADEERSVYDEWDSDGRAQVAVMWTGPEPGYTTVAMAHPGTPWVADGREVTDARHVHVLFDPIRVLAEVEAKRRIIGEHTIWPERSHLRGDWAEPDPMCSVCVSMVMDEDEGGNRFRDLEHEPWPCPTLRLLALPLRRPRRLPRHRLESVTVTPPTGVARPAPPSA